MTSLSVFEKLFAFRETGIYYQITSKELFAYRTKDKNLVYCSIMGKSVPHQAIAIYSGENGLRSFYSLFGSYPNPDDESICYASMTLLECGFSPKNLLPKEVYEEGRAYLGKQAGLYPGLVSHRYMQSDCPVTDDEQQLCEEVLDLVLWIAEEIKKDSSLLSHFLDCDFGEETRIPLFEKEQDRYSIDHTQVSYPYESCYPRPSISDNPNILDLTRMKGYKKNNLQAFFRMTPPIPTLASRQSLCTSCLRQRNGSIAWNRMKTPWIHSQVSLIPSVAFFWIWENHWKSLWATTAPMKS